MGIGRRGANLGDLGDHVKDVGVISVVATVVNLPTPATAAGVISVRGALVPALTAKKLQRSAHDSVNALAADIAEWVEHWNEDPKLFVWHKTADEILERLGRYCAAVTNTEFVDGSA